MPRVDLNRLHKRAKIIFDRENLGRVGEHKQRVVAFILDSKGHVLSEGWNSYTKTHPIQKRAALANNNEYRCFLHAEVMALTKLSHKHLDKKEAIVVLRMDNHKNLIPGKPCKICSSVIEQYDIQQIIHS
jgi:tRNA(Arg) A34 adenosine deaminase TadA